MKQPKKQKKTGLFITLEGGEGTGKSTQIENLAKRIMDAGYQVVTTREPGGTEKAEQIRDLLLSGSAESLGPEFEAMLFTAARIDHIERVIAPALKKTKIVLCDRYADSTRVYQSENTQEGTEFLDGLEALIKDLAWPDLTLVLDLDPEEGMRRAHKRRADGSDADRFERQSLEDQIARREAFKAIVASEPGRCTLIDASGTEEEIADLLWEEIEPVLDKTLGDPDG